MKKYKIYALLIISGLVLALPWYKNFSGIILFSAFLPLLFVEEYIYENRKNYRSFVIFKYSFLTFFTWNLAATWWIYNAALIGVIAAVLINSLLMSTVVLLFHITKKRIGKNAGFFAFVLYWIGFEHFYHNSEISWPWLTLGNGFAKDIKLIQWYEFTGVLGGSLWVLLINILLFLLIISIISQHKRKTITLSLVCLILILFPILWSVHKFNTYKENNNPYNIVVLQPNIDPYNEKFSGLSNYEQLQILLKLSRSYIDSTTNYVVAPETALDDYIWISRINQSFSIRKIKKFIKKHPYIKFITGVSSYKRYFEGEELSPTVRKSKLENFYYDSYNTAIQIDTTPKIQLYHKSKLVTGVETMPYPKALSFLNRISLNLGGIFGSLGSQKERDVLVSPDTKARVAPVICYESVYGKFVTDYIKKGANMIFVITNDGWWGDTPGYKQHLTYSQLRAIETRRSIARSANTGISCFINQKGEIINPTSWWVRTAIKGKINANNKITYYTKHGDFIGSIAQFFSLLILLSILAHLLINRSSKN